VTRLVHLRAAGVSLLLDGGSSSEGALPAVLHWGADLGALDGTSEEALRAAGDPPVLPNTMDLPVRLAVLPEHADGWAGLPGVRGHRDGAAWSSRFVVSRWQADVAAEGGGRLEVDATDHAAALGLSLVIRMEPSGLVRMQAILRNDHPVEPYVLDGLVLALPVPADAGEILDLAGRWTRERIPQRRPFSVGSVMRESRRGRTGHDATLLLAAGKPGFGFRRGEVWAMHVAWSGNHRTYAEKLPSGQSVLGAGELLQTGEVRLAPGQEYRTPWVVGTYGEGLDRASARAHAWLRDRPGHPRTARPVVLNTWEAVYFDHDLVTLQRLADAAAEVGVERFVLDDGWFRGRRSERAGLGDWYVDDAVWPQGLGPLIEHVQRRGMDFGLWVEPEMVNLDSDLARAHPDWILATGGRLPPESRHQQVLDLSRPQAFGYLLERLDALLGEYPIAYLKWDHNRDLVDAGHSDDGRSGVHSQTAALYRLLDELRRRHPGVEIESCSSGGGRVDLEILQRTDRVWASDSNDALERQRIQRWTGLLVPPELMGAHIGPPRSHTTGRRHELGFRAGTALFGHMGIEWDITRASAAERAVVASWVATYKRLRSLLHTGTVVRSDHPDPALWAHGVVSDDRRHALYALVAMDTGVTAPPGRVRLPGLDYDVSYRLRALAPSAEPPGGASSPLPGGMFGSPGWMRVGQIVLTGAVLAGSGIEAPALWPESLMLVEVVAT
jgi:alpha-galactosidase